MSKKKAIKRLTDFDFSQEFCHVALVDEAANEHGIVVMKAKQVEQTPVEKNAEPISVSDKPKDDNMSVEKTKEVEVVEKAMDEKKPCTKCEKAPCACEKKDEKKVEKAAVVVEETVVVEKAVEKVEDTRTLEEVLKSNSDMAEQLEVFKAAKVAAEKSEFVSKAKEQGNIVKDEEADALFVIKSLAPEAYEVVMKAITTANTALDAMEVVVDPVGSSEAGDLDKEVSFQDRVITKSKELMSEDASLKPNMARDKARGILRDEIKKAASAE